MEISELRNKKNNLSIECNKLALLKKKLYSNMDIESPISDNEKELNRQLSKLYSELNSTIKEIKNTK